MIGHCFPVFPVKIYCYTTQRVNIFIRHSQSSFLSHTPCLISEPPGFKNAPSPDITKVEVAKGFLTSFWPKMLMLMDVINLNI